MNIVGELIDQGRFTHFLALTFNVGLGYFEALLHRAMRLRGLRCAAIVADRNALSASLEAELPYLRGLGRGYVAVGARAAVSFHPKVLLASGPDEARLYVGSGNLSHGGLEGNHEVFDTWSVKASDAAIPAAFSTVHDYLRDAIAHHAPGAAETLHDTLAGAFAADVLSRKPRTVRDDTELWRSPPDLLPQLPSPPAPCDRLLMMAPSFDANGDAAIAIAKHLRAERFEVWTDLRTTNLSLEAADAIAAAGGAVKIVHPERPLHAKVLFASGPGFALGIHGSANLSKAAWRGHNAELVVVRHGSAALEIEALLRGLPTPKDLTDAHRIGLANAVDRSTDIAPEIVGPALSRAEWMDRQTVEVHGGANTFNGSIDGFEFKISDTLRKPNSYERIHNDTWRVISPTGIERGVPVILRAFSEGEPGPWVPVADPWELRDTARARTHDEIALEEFFDGGDESTNEGLVRFLAGMFERRARVASRTSAVHEVAKTGAAPKPGGPNLVDIPEAAFHGRTEDTEATRSSRHEALSPSRLLHQLLFGDVQERGDLSGGDGSETESPEAPAASPPQGPNAPSARHKPEAFAAITRRATDAYLADVGRPEGAARAAPRLAEDALVLSACFQRAFRARELSIHQFLAAQVRALRALIGAPHAPLPRALAKIPPEVRQLGWIENALLPAMALPLYNVCLAEHAVTKRDERPAPDFASSAPVLWFRNVLRHAPPGLGAVVTETESQIYSLKAYGVLWLADEWPDLEEEVPFDLFVRSLIDDAKALEALRGALAGAPTCACPEDGATVISVVSGEVCSGFCEEDRNKFVVQAFTGAFQAASVIGDSRYERLQRVPVPSGGHRARYPSRLYDPATLEAVADANTLRAIRLLKRIAES